MSTELEPSLSERLYRTTLGRLPYVDVRERVRAALAATRSEGAGVSVDVLAERALQIPEQRTRSS
jgi:hypothetical protein